jgi:C-terminal processing protease CtpA/Prc
MGFGGVRQGEKTVITALQQDSPGDAAGLNNGDELISAEGKPVRGMPTAEIGWKIRQLSHKGTKPVTLTIRRDGKIRELELDLSSIYP